MRPAKYRTLLAPRCPGWFSCMWRRQQQHQAGVLSILHLAALDMPSAARTTSIHMKGQCNRWAMRDSSPSSTGGSACCSGPHACRCQRTWRCIPYARPPSLISRGDMLQSLRALKLVSDPHVLYCTSRLLAELEADLQQACVCSMWAQQVSRKHVQCVWLIRFTSLDAAID